MPRTKSRLVLVLALVIGLVAAELGQQPRFSSSPVEGFFANGGSGSEVSDKVEGSYAAATEITPAFESIVTVTPPHQKSL